MRRALVVFHEQVPGGATLSVVRLHELMAERGWDLSYMVAAGSELERTLADRGYEVRGAARGLAFSREALALPPGTFRRLASIPGYGRAVGRALRETGAELLHANSLFTLPEALLARGLRVPAVLHVHEMIPEGRKGRLARRMAYRAGIEVVAVSEASAARLVEGDRRPLVVHEAAPLPARVERDPEQPPVVGTVGVISTRKGSDLFIDAAELLIEQRGDLRFEMVGGLTDELEVSWARRQLDRARRVGISHVERADVSAALARWSVFVLPSRRDPFPIAMIEAMGAGLPVVGTRVDGIPEQVPDGCGLLVEGDDPAALAAAIGRLLDDHELAERLGAAAREHALEAFSLEAQADALAEAYELAGRPRARRTARP